MRAEESEFSKLACVHCCPFSQALINALYAMTSGSSKPSAKTSRVPGPASIVAPFSQALINALYEMRSGSSKLSAKTWQSPRSTVGAAPNLASTLTVRQKDASSVYSGIGTRSGLVQRPPCLGQMLWGGQAPAGWEKGIRETAGRASARRARRREPGGMHVRAGPPQYLASCLSNAMPRDARRASGTRPNSATPGGSKIRLT